MKIIQSFWSGNLKDIRDNRAWLSYEHHWLSWILSCNQLRKFYDDVELYTDSFGYEILIEKLKLPYTKVYVVLDEMNRYPKDLWAIAKIKVYELQNEPFLHVDGDVFIWDQFPNELMNCDLICQNLENTTDYYREMWNQIAPNLTFIPNEIQDYHKNLSNLGCNMGIIGGNNINFFKNYTKKSFEFINENKKSWNNFNLFNFNVFFEQQLFYEMAYKKAIPINYLFEEVWGDNSYLGLANFNEVPHKKFYLHLLGDFKRRPSICKNLESFVIKFYPKYFERLKNIIPEKYNYFDIEISDYNFSEIDNDKLIKEFNRNLKLTNLSLSSKNLVARDLYFIGLSEKFDYYIEKENDFWLVLINFYEIKKFENEEQVENQNLRVFENFKTQISYDFDQIDFIIIDELKNPILKKDFFKVMYNYLEKDFTENDLQDFNIFLTNRLRYFLDCKILAIFEEQEIQ